MIPNDTYIKQLLLNAAVIPPEKVWVLVSDSLNELKTDDLLKQSLLSAELTPPDDLWQKMTERFDEETADYSIAAKINQTEIEAPSFIWDAISNELDHELIANKLNEASVAPPFTAWGQIEFALDEEADENIKKKLLNTEAEAPADAWNYIEKQITAGQGAKVIPFARRIAPVYKLAAAAMVTGVLAWGAYQLFSANENTVTPAIVQNTPEVKVEQNTIVPLPVQQPEQAPAVATVKTNSKQEKVKQNKPAARKQTLPVAANDNNSIAIAEPVNHNSETILPHRDVVHHKKNTSLFTGSVVPENQYMLVLNDNGDLIRVSKKIATMKCANGSGDIPVDAVAALQTRDCDDQIKRWQQKIAMSTLVSPSAGYIDINELILATEK
jgi:RNase P/RNase MRP subunit p29